jgi:prevent-host-death family protein
MSDSSAVRVWQLHVAKARFSELFALALEGGPQRVQRHGKDEVVVIAARDFERLKNDGAHTARTAFDVFAPLNGSGLTLKRSRERGREIEL